MERRDGAQPDLFRGGLPLLPRQEPARWGSSPERAGNSGVLSLVEARVRSPPSEPCPSSWQAGNLAVPHVRFSLQRRRQELGATLPRRCPRRHPASASVRRLDVASHGARKNPAAKIAPPHRGSPCHPRILIGQKAAPSVSGKACDLVVEPLCEGPVDMKPAQFASSTRRSFAGSPQSAGVFLLANRPLRLPFRNLFRRSPTERGLPLLLVESHKIHSVAA